ncbi:Hypothetical protein SRAE_X000120600 [Strongyloides ratti]|uniref:Uncharacterized protein n=1 Tax=Strongyloides ratti TaxID=34506 RepID=A0A090KPD8_STRRB|nr:Hypothetical protein SRAE_X000120600 [Strongyloides ratti]CEF59458.1 Hypothetical protein SRAE_X000120600 [Strongyloides ratti]
MATIQISYGAPNRVMMRFGKRFAPYVVGHPFYQNSIYQHDDAPDNAYKINSYLNKNQPFPVVIENN